MENIIQEEQEHLNKTIKQIENSIAYYDELFDKQKHTIIGFKEGQRGTQFTRQFMMSLSATNSYKLNRIKDNPYFGRFDFIKDNSSEVKKIYVGKKDVLDSENKLLTYDWRNPICSLYYDNGLGHFSYDSPMGKIGGNITLRRQIKIEDGQLKNVIDVNSISNDEFLIPFLNEKADNRLKNIVSSIQSEQNKVIREPINKNIIIQGVAGSGKTTVALHRIAYLMYENSKKINSNQYLIIGPNQYFMNYISDLLPDLDVDMVSQTTFPELISEVLNGKIKIEDQTYSLEKLLKNQLNPKNARFKSSLLYEKKLEKFLNKYLLDLFPENMKIENVELLSIDRIKNFLNLNDSRGAIFNQLDNLYKFTQAAIKENKSDIKSAIWQNYRDEYKKLPKGSARRQEILSHVDYLDKEVDSGCKNILKEYFSYKKIKPIDIYKSFLESIKDEQVSGIDTENLYEETIDYLNKGKIRYEDLGALLYIAIKLYDTKEYRNYAHVVIDEAQDYGIFQFKMLKRLFQNSTFSILGDLNQSIYSYRGVEDWESVKQEVFNSEAEIKKLNKSYRATKEIIDSSNSILKEINCEKAEPVLRHGKDTELISLEENNNYIDAINKKIIDFKMQGYKSIAIITKDENETNLLYKKLKKGHPDLEKITYKDTDYNGGLSIMPSYLSKGLEFDSVIISDASEEKYNSDSITDMKLLYVATTRPLHELSIMHNGNITKAFSSLTKNNEKQKVLKK